MHQMKKIMIMPISVMDYPDRPRKSTITLECTMCHKQRKLVVPEDFQKRKPATTCPSCGSEHASFIAGWNTIKK